MKTLPAVTLLFLLLLVSCKAFAQDVYRIRYFIPEKLVYSDTTIYLQKESQIAYKDLTPDQKKKIDTAYPIGKTISITTTKNLNDEKVTVEESVVIDNQFLNSQKFSFPTQAKPPVGSGNVMFEEDKIYVNPWKLRSGDLYYFKLDNRKSAKLVFTDFTITALALPLKYRLKDESEGRSEEFSAGLSAGVFGGFSIGKSKFFYRKKVGNKVNTTKLTTGLLLSSSTVTLNKNNTSLADNPITDDTEITKGLASVGLGATVSINKLNIGAFYGWDYSVGDDSEKWNYNKKPWIGIALGYSLISLQ